MSRSKYVFDKRLADAACEFFPRFLCFVEGEWAGKPFRLSPWEAFHTGQIFGWRRRKDGRRRYRFVRGWIPRKNAKSTWAAGIGHLLTIGDNEPGAQVYSHALDKNQASLVFNIATRMASMSPSLAAQYEMTKTGLFCPALMAGFRPLSGEAFGKHGLSPHANIGDEAHAWRDGRLHTFLIQGMGSRRQPMDLTISTAGEIKTYGHELYEASMAILAKPKLDEQTYVFCYEAPQDADWTDPDVWALANPNLGISLKREFLEAECKRALASPRLENDFRRYHLNQWVEQAKRWFAMHRWADNTERPKDKSFWKRLREICKGRKALGAIDLGSTDDITCQMLLFPPESEGQRIILIPEFWVPEDTVPTRDSPRTPYRKWVADGALLTTPGNVTDYAFIEKRVMDNANEFEMGGIAFDPWSARQMAQRLMEDGATMIEFRQGYASMGEPSKELDRLFHSGQLEHGNHPVLEWMFGNATYRKDPAGNIKPDKEKAAEKIDGVVAGVMAVGLMTGAEQQGVSVFELLARQAAATAIEVAALKPHLVQYLQYVHNAGGNGTIALFDDNWEPIGPTLRAELMPAFIAEKDGKLVLTESGKAALTKPASDVLVSPALLTGDLTPEQEAAILKDTRHPRWQELHDRFEERLVMARGDDDE